MANLIHRGDHATRFGEVRGVVQEAPSASGWARLCRLVDAWQLADPRGLEEIIPYMEGALRRWPDALRVCPQDWAPYLGWSSHASRLRLVRALRLDATTLRALGPNALHAPTLRRLTALEVDARTHSTIAPHLLPHASGRLRPHHATDRTTAHVSPLEPSARAFLCALLGAVLGHTEPDGLRHLTLAHAPADALATLADAPRLSALTHLRLVGALPGVHLVRQWGATRALEALRTLHLEAIVLDQAKVRAWCAALPDALETLRLEGCVREETIRALGGASLPASLRHLHLSTPTPAQGQESGRLSVGQLLPTLTRAELSGLRTLEIIAHRQPTPEDEPPAPLDASLWPFAATLESLRVEGIAPHPPRALAALRNLRALALTSPGWTRADLHTPGLGLSETVRRDRLDTLHLRLRDASEVTRALRSLGASPGEVPLRALTLYDPTPASLLALDGAVAAGGLEALHLRCDHPTLHQDTLRSLATSRAASTLHTLTLGDCPLRDEDITALITAPFAATLRTLQLNAQALTGEGWRALSSSAHALPRLQNFRITRTHALPTNLGDATLLRLIQHPSLPHEVRELALRALRRDALTTLALTTGVADTRTLATLDPGTLADRIRRVVMV